MKIDKIPSLLAFEGKKTKKIESNDHFGVTLIALSKGQRLDEHTSPTDAFIYVLEGEANFNLEGNANFLSVGDGLSFGANQVHSVNALTDFKMLLVK